MPHCIQVIALQIICLFVMNLQDLNITSFKSFINNILKRLVYRCIWKLSSRNRVAWDNETPVSYLWFWHQITFVEFLLLPRQACGWLVASSLNTNDQSSHDSWSLHNLLFLIENALKYHKTLGSVSTNIRLHSWTPMPYGSSDRHLWYLCPMGAVIDTRGAYALWVLCCAGK